MKLFGLRLERGPTLLSCGAILALLAAPRASAQPLLVAGSPSYDRSARSGFVLVQFVDSPCCVVNDSGMAVGLSDKFVAGSDKSSRAVRWDGSGMAATELG